MYRNQILGKIPNNEKEALTYRPMYMECDACVIEAIQSNLRIYLPTIMWIPQNGYVL
jgi:hypothetical protein